MTTDYDVVVVGAGIVGCAIARELAPDHDVLVLDKGQIAGETTGKASGLITIVPDIPDKPETARYAIDFFREYDGTGAYSFTDRPSIQLVTPAEVDDAEDLAATVAGNGFDASYLNANELEEQYPGAFVLDDFAGGIEYRDTGWVDPYTYTMSVKDDAEDAGAEFRTGVTVESITVEGGRVSGLQTDEGSFACSDVVCATGWRTRELVGDFVDLPIRPFRWQAVNLEVDRDLTDYPIAWEFETGTYWRPEHNGDLHVGGGTYYVREPGDRRDSVTEAFRTLVATRLGGWVQGLGDARIVAEDCCPEGDVATPDNFPIVDQPADAPAGLTVATGCPIGGIMTSPCVGRVARTLLTGEPCPFPVEHFAVDRFDSRSSEFDCSYVYDQTAPENHG